jgi:hypothetical protein
VFFVITFITAILALLQYDPVRSDGDNILGAGADRRVELGAAADRSPSSSAPVTDR